MQNDPDADTENTEQKPDGELILNTPDSINKADFPIIVIGASAGGLEALKTLVAGIPNNFDAAICIVWHMSPNVRGILPQILNKTNTLYAANAFDGELIKKNRIYVAPPDHHLLIEGDHFRISRGPKENRFRPAVDPLFRSAACSYGAQVIGVILTGALDDGTAGLWMVKSRGGFAIVQHPADAEVPSMPESALRHVKVDYSVPVSQMARLLISLVKEIIINPANIIMKKDDTVKTEISIAADENALTTDVMQLGELSPFTCPECHGVLTSIQEGTLKRYRCHTGHAFTVDSLLSALSENIEENLWTAIRSIKESMLLLNHIGDHYAEIKDKQLAALYFKKALEANQRAEKVREVVTHHEQLSTDSMLLEAEIKTDF